MHIIRRVIDKGGEYYSLVSEPTESHLFRIMNSIAIRKSDTFKEVILPNLEPDRRSNDYVDKVTYIEHEDGDDRYIVHIAREEPDGGWPADSYYIFINHNAYELTEIDGGFYILHDNPLYALIRDAEIYRKQDISSIVTEATLWSCDAMEMPTICYGLGSDSIEYDVEVVENNSSNFINIPSGVAGEDYDRWHELTSVSEISTTYSNKHLQINNYIGIAFIDANSYFAPRYIRYEVRDESDNLLYNMRIETGISDILSDSLPTYKVDKRILWRGRTIYVAATPEDPEDYDIADFGTPYDEYPTHIDIKLTRVHLKVNMPLIFAEPLKFKITDYTYDLWDDTAPLRMMSFAATNYTSPHKTNRKYYYCGYYGRDRAFDRSSGRTIPEFSHKDFNGHIIIPPYLERTIISPSDEVHALTVDESGRNIIFNLTRLKSYLLEEDDSDNDRHLPIRMKNRAIFNYGIDSVSIKSNYVELLYLTEDQFVSTTPEPGEMDYRGIYYYEGNLYYRVVHTELTEPLQSLNTNFEVGDELRSLGNALISGTRVPYIYAGGSYTYNITGEVYPFNRYYAAGTGVSDLHIIMINGDIVSETVGDIDDDTSSFDITNKDYLISEQYSGEHYIIINREVIRVEFDGTYLNIIERGCRGTTRTDHPAGSSVRIFDYLTLDPNNVIEPLVLRVNTDKLEYDGDYKSKITLTKYAPEKDIHNSLRVYVMEIVWQ